MTSFDGFSRELPEFLAALKNNNNKAWFDGNRKRYEAVFLEPAKAFVAAIAPEMHKISPAIAAEPRVNGAIMRINRDTRFSKDKTPYKTTMDIHFLEGEKTLKSNPAYVFRLTATGLHIGAGAYGFNKRQLNAWRQAVVGEKRGKAFGRILQDARRAGYESPGEPHYKTVPRGFPADHPNADCLRHNRFFLTKVFDDPDALFGPGAVDFCMDAYRPLRPFQSWLVTHVGDLE